MVPFRDLYVFHTERHGRVELPPSLRPPTLACISAPDGLLSPNAVAGLRLRFAYLTMDVWRRRDHDTVRGCVVMHPDGRVIEHWSNEFLSAPEAALKSLELAAEPWPGAPALQRFAAAAMTAS